MYKLEFTLKQHTPIIHFQHDQDGATLRATEVKPKLDRFIIQKCINNAFDYKKWLVGKGEHEALDYKMRIDPISDFKYIQLPYSQTNDGKFRPDFPNLFGNVESENEKRHFSFCKLSKISIVVYSSQLKEFIEKNIITFFASSTFGFRQTKGFGSYNIENSNEINDKYLNFDVNNVSEYQFIEVFKCIEIFHKTLKSGINLKGKINRTDRFSTDKLYFKSMMFHYAKNLATPQQWDKRTIRHKLFYDDIKYRDTRNKKGILDVRENLSGTVQFTTQKESENYYDFRDLLGLSTEQDCLYYSDKKIIKTVQNNNDEEIERFSSPIIYKPTFENGKWNVDLILNEIPKEYLTSKVRVKNKNHSTTLDMYPKFNLKSFITRSILDFDDNMMIINEDFNNINEVKIIKEIYNCLKKSIIILNK